VFRTATYQIANPAMMTVIATLPPVQKDSFFGSLELVSPPTGFVSISEAT
jgi:hypothetical protein